MRRALLALLVAVASAAAVACTATRLHAQSAPHPSPYAGRVDEPAASFMHARWQPSMNERAYCVKAWHVEGEGARRVLVVTEVDTAKTIRADTLSVTADCGPLPLCHTHPAKYMGLSGADFGSGVLEQRQPFICAQWFWQAYTFGVLWDRVDAALLAKRATAGAP